MQKIGTYQPTQKSSTGSRKARKLLAKQKLEELRARAKNEAELGFGEW